MNKNEYVCENNIKNDHYVASTSYFQTLKSIQMSGLVSVYFLSSKKKKNYYAQLTERTFELHKSMKSYIKKKSAKYIVDLSTCFNVSQQHFPKFRLCVSLMTPDDTLLFKDKANLDTKKWYNLMLSALIPARALRLGRPVFSNEFFECAYDVIIKANPRLRIPRRDVDNFPNICIKRPELSIEKYRLCIYPHSVVLCRLGIEAGNELVETKTNKNVRILRIPPFKRCNFIEFPRFAIKNFGIRENFFFLRIGHLSNFDACEIWMQALTTVCKPKESAIEIFATLQSIIYRENRKQKNGFMFFLDEQTPYNKFMPLSARSSMHYTNSIASKQKKNKKNNFLSLLIEKCKTTKNIAKKFKATKNRNNTLVKNNCSYSNQSLALTSYLKNNLNCDKLDGFCDEKLNKINNNKKILKTCTFQKNFLQCSKEETNAIDKALVLNHNYHNKVDNYKIDLITNTNYLNGNFNKLLLNNYEVNNNIKNKVNKINITVKHYSTLSDKKKKISDMPEIELTAEKDLKINKDLNLMNNTFYVLNNSSLSMQTCEIKNLWTSLLNLKNDHIFYSISSKKMLENFSYLFYHYSPLLERQFLNFPYQSKMTNNIDKNNQNIMISNLITAQTFQNHQINQNFPTNEFLINDCYKKQKNANSVNDQTFFLLDRSNSHLAISSNIAVEETCSYASDSGDSCYSSIINGNINSRSLSFLSDVPQKTTNQNYSTKKTSCNCFFGNNGIYCFSNNNKYYVHNSYSNFLSYNYNQNQYSNISTPFFDNSSTITSIFKENKSEITPNKILFENNKVKDVKISSKNFLLSETCDKIDKIQHLYSKVSKNEEKKKRVNLNVKNLNNKINKVKKLHLQPCFSLESCRRQTFSLKDSTSSINRSDKLLLNQIYNNRKKSASNSDYSSLTNSINDAIDKSNDSIKNNFCQSPNNSLESTSLINMKKKYFRSNSVRSSQSAFQNINQKIKPFISPSSTFCPLPNQNLLLYKKSLDRAEFISEDDLVEFECGKISSFADQSTLIKTQSSFLNQKLAAVLDQKNKAKIFKKNVSLSQKFNQNYNKEKYESTKNDFQNNLPSISLTSLSSLFKLEKNNDYDKNSTINYVTDTNVNSPKKYLLDCNSACDQSSFYQQHKSENFSKNFENQKDSFCWLEKPRSISRKLCEVPCFISAEDQAKLDFLIKTVQNKNNKIDDNKEIVQCNQKNILKTNSYETIDKNILKRFSNNVCDAICKIKNSDLNSVKQNQIKKNLKQKHQHHSSKILLSIV